MKKYIFLFLFLPLSILAQNIEIKQNWVDLPQEIKVGDTLTYQLEIIDRTSQGIDIQYVNVDLAYNSTKLTMIEDIEWDQKWFNDSKNNNHWNNYSYNSDRYGTDPADLDQQYSEGLYEKYQNNSNWNIYRIFLQSVQDIQGRLFTQKFRIESIEDTEYADYTNMVQLNWARILDRSYSQQGNVIANPVILNLEDVTGSPSGQITFQLQSPQTVNLQDYSIYIYDEIEYIDDNEDGVVDYKLPALNSTPVLSSGFDQGGRFITNQLKQGVEYFIQISVSGEYDVASQINTYPGWINDIVTVSDVYLTFLQANGGGIMGDENVFEYELQEILADVARDMQEKGIDSANKVDLDDSYALLAHLTGVLDNSANKNNTSSTSKFYPITSMSNGTFNLSTLMREWGKNNDNQQGRSSTNTIILDSTEPTTIQLAHGFMGDVDLSHSTTPQLDQTTEIIKNQAFPGFDGAWVAISAMEPSSTDADIFTQKTESGVEMTVNIEKDDLAGLQLNMRYDNTILEFENITFNTGNSMTNFAKEIEDRLIIGAIDPTGQSTIIPGTILVLNFKTKQTITNTAGLVSFYVTDAVEKNGRKVKLNLK